MEFHSLTRITPIHSWNVHILIILCTSPLVSGLFCYSDIIFGTFSFSDCIMSAKAINEATGKGLLNKQLEGNVAAACRFAVVSETTNWSTLAQENPWLLTEVILREA